MIDVTRAVGILACGSLIDPHDGRRSAPPRRDDPRGIRMTPKTASNVRHCVECLALLYGPPVSESERREAARGLGMEHALPDAQDELPLDERKEG